MRWRMRAADTAARQTGPTLKKVAIVVSSPLTAQAFLVNQIEALCGLYDVQVIANVESKAEMFFLPEAANVLPVRIERDPSPLRDLRALVHLTRVFRNHRFDLVHSTTPKAGLLAMTAASVARIPVRIHIFTGQVWVTRRGPSRWVLKNADRVTAALATDVLVDSISQRAFLLEQKVIRAKKSRVLASGSISGVDTSRFRPDSEARAAVRKELGIDASDVLFLFVGRLKRDKGVLLAVEAFRQLPGIGQSTHMVFVGPDEEGLADQYAADPIPGVSFVAPTTHAERYMAAADVLCLPSRREGFGITVIEAASVGVPAIASRIYGITDAVIDGETGLLHTVDDVGDIVRCMTQLRDDPELRNRLGAAARERAVADFSRDRLTAALLEAYRVIAR